MLRYADYVVFPRHTFHQTLVFPPLCFHQAFGFMRCVVSCVAAAVAQLAVFLVKGLLFALGK